LQKVPFKAAWVTELDETAMHCDLVLPLLSPLEDFGTHVAANQFEGTEISIQQPLMERLYPETRAFGDVMLDLLKRTKPDSYKSFPDYYAYLKSAVINAKPAFLSQAGDEEFWENTLSAGVLRRPASLQPLPAMELHPEMIQQPAPGSADADYPFCLIPAVSASMRDGRPANLSWLQESPDPLTTVVWDSWAELHPSTAKAMQVREGDVLIIKSAHGSIRAKAYLMPGIHPGAVAVPIGQGHESYGRYATHVGVNPLKILDPIFDRETGELAIYATRVAITKTDQHERISKDEGPISTSGSVRTKDRSKRADRQGRRTDYASTGPEAGRHARGRSGRSCQGGARGVAHLSVRRVSRTHPLDGSINGHLQSVPAGQRCG
jgi:molybdopterin-containing oxidoreductase family iron-sulfur binding subunit